LAHALGLGVFLASLWLLLSGYLLGWLLALGFASIVLIVYIAHRMDVADHEGFPVHLTLAALTYWPWLFKEIVVSNIVVARAIVGRLKIQPQVLTTKATQDSELGRVVYANSITLTPGTISINLVGEDIEVHALLDETADGVREGGMDRRVSAMTNHKLPATKGRAS